MSNSGVTSVTRPTFSRRQFRLTSDIPNPKLDRRRKRGPYSMEVFPAGLVVDVEEMRQQVIKDGVAHDLLHKSYQVSHEQVPEEVKSEFERQDRAPTSCRRTSRRRPSPAGPASAPCASTSSANS